MPPLAKWGIWYWYAEEKNKNIDSDYIKCFEKALLDIVNGILPLGGRTMLGHGMFSGKLFKNKTEISYDSL